MENERKKKRTRIIVIVVVLATLCIAVARGILLSRSSSISPLLDVWPRPNDTSTNSLIQSNKNETSSWLSWSEFFAEYDHSESAAAANRVPCSFGQHQLVEEQVCDVPVDVFIPCNPTNQYDHKAPCVFLRLNKIFNWSPMPYNSTEDLPEMMPEDLKQYIKVISGRPDANTVWVSCEGETPDDVENIGPLQYFPRRGFPAYYYPFTNKEGYLSPLVAVMFEKPKTGVIISIECKAWAKNIQFDHEELRGSVHFKLMVDRK